LNRKHRIVIVGVAPVGWPLRLVLGDRFSRHGKAEIVLVDAAGTHMWKPLLHELASGTLTRPENEIDFFQ
jgi:NADH dehydrogenase